MLRRMLDPTQARDLLAESLPAFNGNHKFVLSGISVLDVAVRDAWIVQYSVEIRDADTQATHRHLLMAQHFPGGGLEKAAKRIRRQAHLLLERRPELAQLWAQRSDLKLLVFPFPIDAKMEQLPLVTDPEAVCRRFQGSAALEGLAKFEHCLVKVLRYLPGKRCQILYVLRSDPAQRVAVLGKTFRDGRGLALFGSMQKVAALFARNGDPDLAAPRPLDYLPDWKMVLQEEAPGITLHEILRRGGMRSRHLVSAARTVAILHNSSLGLTNCHRITDEIRLVEWSHRRLAAAGFWEGGFPPLLEKITGFGANLRPSSLVPVHRDFYDKQLLIDEERTTLIDLDTLAFGYAEIDIANFIAHLHLRALQYRGVKALKWQDLFLASYVSHARQPPDPRRLKFFLAAAYFRLARKYRLRPKGKTIATQLLRRARALFHPNGETRELAITEGGVLA
ncbi:MAG: hypothetical protein ACE5JX_14290 [Acidobacteriota bacterium]